MIATMAAVFLQMVRHGDLPQHWDKLQNELNGP